MYEYTVLVLICIVFVAMLFYIYIKDTQTSRKFFLYEKAIEELNKKVYELEKNNFAKKNDTEDIRIKDIENDIENRLKEETEKITNYIVAVQNEFKSELKTNISELYSKIENIEEKFKNFYSVSDNYQSNNKQIVSLHEKGLSVSEIARNLRVGMGEVELVLKLAGVR